MGDYKHMEECVVSIVIPIFNRKELVCLMINSILRQTFHYWELLLIDDGSTDGTLEMLHQFSTIDSRIHFYIRDRLPKGAPTCRNIGLEHAKGKYVIFFDSDDLIPNYTLMQRVGFMEKHSDLDFSIFPAMTFWDKVGDGKIIGLNIGRNDLKHFVDCHLPFLVVTNIYKTSSLFKKKIKWDENLASLQDTDFNIQNILRNNKYDYAYDVDIDYYIRELKVGSISQNICKQSHGESHVYFINKMFQELPLEWMKRNRWAIRRRIIYMYILLSDSSENNLQQLKHLVGKNDILFYYIFCMSVSLHNLLKKHSCPKSLFLAFPYYAIYQKIYSIFIKMKMNKALKLKNNFYK